MISSQIVPKSKRPHNESQIGPKSKRPQNESQIDPKSKRPQTASKWKSNRPHISNWIKNLSFILRPFLLGADLTFILRPFWLGADLTWGRFDWKSKKKSFCEILPFGPQSKRPQNESQIGPKSKRPQNESQIDPKSKRPQTASKWKSNRPHISNWIKKCIYID
jgi:hypothetical protein